MAVLRKLMASVGATAAVLALSAIPASAAGTGTISPNPVAVTGGQTSATVTVNWSGLQNPGHTLFITQCKKIESDPTFDFAADCSNLSEVPVNASANPGGAASKSFSVFRGENPDGDSGWGCYATGDTIPAGITSYTNCFVRVTEDAESNTSTDFSIPFTFEASTGGNLPETSTAVLLPITAGGVLIAGWFLQRRRRTSAAI